MSEDRAGVRVATRMSFMGDLDVDAIVRVTGSEKSPYFVVVRGLGEPAPPREEVNLPQPEPCPRCGPEWAEVKWKVACGEAVLVESKCLGCGEGR